MESYGERLAAIKSRQVQVAAEIDRAVVGGRQQINAAEELLDRIARIRAARARRRMRDSL